MSIQQNLKFLVGVAVGAVFVGGVFLSKPLKAATGNPVGSCGGLIDISYKNVTPTSGASYGANVLMLVDFDTLTINARANVTTHPAGNWKSTTASNSIGPVSFTLTAGPFANSHIITPVNGSGIPAFVVLSVNGGSTFLLKAENDRGTGVCQKI